MHGSLNRLINVSYVSGGNLFSISIERREQSDQVKRDSFKKILKLS